jgi:post-segregation antitoxin (ccd killing protein)
VCVWLGSVVYLPDELDRRARAAGLNVSAVTRSAIEAELAAAAASEWLARAAAQPAAPLTHDAVLDAVGTARDELGDRRG